MRSFDSIYERLLDYADNMKVIDRHEHIYPYKTFTGDEPDVLSDYLSHYITTDLQSAGMNSRDIEKARDYKIGIIERFRRLEPYLERVRNTSYYRSLEIAAQRIHNTNKISIDTIEELNDK